MADASRLLVPGTNFRIFDGQYGAANTGLPDNTVPYGGAWPAGLASLGYTEDGIALNVGRDIEDIVVDQEVDPVLLLSTGRDIRISTNLAEFRAATLSAAFGYGTATTTASTATVRGQEDFDLAGGAPAIRNRVSAIEAQAQNGEPFRAIFFKAVAVSDGDLNFAKTDNVAIPFEMRALPDTSVSPSRVAKLRQVLPLA